MMICENAVLQLSSLSLPQITDYIGKDIMRIEAGYLNERWNTYSVLKSLDIKLFTNFRQGMDCSPKYCEILGEKVNLIMG